MVQKLRTDPSLIFHVISDDIQITKDVAIVTILAKIEDDYIQVHGAAKRHPDDKANSRVAALVAYNNAVASLHSKLNKRAMGAIKHADDMSRLRKSGQQKTKKVSSKSK